MWTGCLFLNISTHHLLEWRFCANLHRHHRFLLVGFKKKKAMEEMDACEYLGSLMT